jgi:histidyl-tRNA synthetase
VDLQRPIGTRDFGPADMAVRNHVASLLREVFRRYGYAEVGTPTFEALELFTAKSGDGVIGELYNFKDKGDRDLTLRPELTAPVMRMYFADHFNDPKPLKWSYFGNCFRYDRPQAGRYREFWQFGCEQIGAGTPLAYAELIALADACLRAVGLRHKELRIGHVKILAHCVDTFGFDAATRGAMMRAIDKRNDVEVRRLASQKEGCAAALDRLFLVMDAPTVAAAREALLGEAAEALADLEACLAHLHALGVRDARLDLGIARGLDYYTGIVFEVHCPLLGAQKQLLGGGGYDLSGVFGGTPTPTMGFGLGFDRTIVALEAQAAKEGQPAAFPKAPGPALYVGLLGEAAAARVLPIVARLRDAGVAVEVDLLGRKPGAVAKHADAVGARHLAIVGDRDLESGAVQLKDLATGQSESVLLEDLASRAF